ncbi:hypothetical protein D3C85_1826900 [compost metagenome]
MPVLKAEMSTVGDMPTIRPGHFATDDDLPGLSVIQQVGSVATLAMTSDAHGWG